MWYHQDLEQEWNVMTKALIKLGIKGNFLNPMNGIYEKCTAVIILNGGKAGSLSPKIKTKAKMPTLTASIQHCTRGPS